MRNRYFAYLSNIFVSQKTSESIVISHILLNLGFFGLHFCCRQYYGSPFSHFYVINWPHGKAANSVEKRKIMAIMPFQGHSRSPILVLIESPYATSYS